MNSVVHFEMGYFDRERAKAFYAKAFGWELNQMGPEMGNYVVATTGASDPVSGRPTAPGYINGGLYQKTDHPSSHAPSIVVAVEDIREAMQRLQVAGGTIMSGMNPDGTHTMEPTEIPGVGFWISAQDTEGNRISLLQPKT